MDTVTWRDRLQLPHESNWGLQQKKCFIDAYTVMPLRGYDSSMNHAQETFLGGKLTALHGRYCPECAKHGYHAWFHQLIFFNHCVLHPEQKLLDIDYDTTKSHRESFFQKIGTRPIDLMDNADFRHEIETKICLDFDRIAVIDIMEYRHGAQSCFRPIWYESTLRALRECCIGTSFTTARRVAIIPKDADKRIKEWASQYLNGSVIPWLYSKIEVKNNELGYSAGAVYAADLNNHWQQTIFYDPRETLILLMHKEYLDICAQVGGVECYKTILKSIQDEVFGTQLCDYRTYGKIISLILASHYCTADHLKQLYCGQRYIKGIPRLSSKLEFSQIDLNQVINIRKGNYDNMVLPILAAILKDVFSYTSSVLGDLMKGKRCLTDREGITDIFSSFFCLPVSQYIAIWNS